MPGRVQAWLLGSGMAAPRQNVQPSKQDASKHPFTLESALADGLPTVLDAGALHLAGQSSGATVITPHHRELAVLLGRHGTAVTVQQIAAEPGEWAGRAAIMFGVVVLLKGSPTHIASPAGTRLRVTGAPSWLATAGTGDVLAGILGALVATHSAQISTSADALTPLAATAALLHAQAGRRASAGGPLLALDVAEAIPSVIARLLAA
jgi:NAD(P)H-hydrate repair Nnr-like enzyme with NAD(P)H-hydrate dehydratase domain